MARVVGESPEVLNRCSCRGCAALIEYGLNEVQRYYGTDYSGGPDAKEWINCPRCGREVILRTW